jgi:hypothetical protein
VAKIMQATLVALNLRRKDKTYRWYYYHHI